MSKRSFAHFQADHANDDALSADDFLGFPPSSPSVGSSFNLDDDDEQANEAIEGLSTTALSSPYPILWNQRCAAVLASFVS